MTLSQRATRAGSAFLVFGVLVSMIPTGSGFVLAADNCPAPQPAGGGGGGGGLLAAAAIGGGLFALSRGGGGGLFPFVAGRRKKKKTKKELEQERLRQQFERLDRFTRPTDAGSNPALNH